MRKLLMTGGTGMLGIALTDYALRQDCDITILARSDSERIENIPASERVHTVCCDISRLQTIDSRLEAHYDAFYHLGWQGTTGEAREDMFLQNLNVRYTLDAVELARRKGCEVFIGTGSQAEYGRVSGGRSATGEPASCRLTPATPANPETGYGMAKLCAGQMSRALCRRYGIRHIWFRILSVYGPCDNANSMIMSGIRAMLAGQSPQYTKGEQMWDYLYCRDAARALWLAARKGRDGAVYCLGSGQARPLKEFILAIWRQMGMSGEPRFGSLPYSENQVMYLCADISELSKDLGFEPEYSFEEGIRETIAWCRGRENRKNSQI